MLNADWLARSPDSLTLGGRLQTPEGLRKEVALGGSPISRRNDSTGPPTQRTISETAKPMGMAWSSIRMHGKDDIKLPGETSLQGGIHGVEAEALNETIMKGNVLHRQGVGDMKVIEAENTYDRAMKSVVVDDDYMACI